MATKRITGTIAGGYTLMRAYTALTITSHGVIDGAASGGAALTSQYGASINNAGTIVGGAGAHTSIYGKEGGAGASLAGGGTLQNAGAIIGGLGGAARWDGGLGGYGVLLTGAGSIDNTGSILGGAGGIGDENDAGRGGTGVSLTGGGTVNNIGRIAGGAAGRGGGSYPGYYGGVGVSLSMGGLIVNSGVIAAGGHYAVGVAMGDGGTVNNTGTIVGAAGISIVDGGIVDNSGIITGFGLGAHDYNGAGIYALAANGTAIVTNLGTIIGYGKPYPPFGSQNLAAVDLACTGTFTNGPGALAQGYSGFVGSRYASVVNYGVIEGVKEDGVAGGVSVINHAGGLIEGGACGVAVSRAIVTNFGTIEGAGLALYLTNSRLIAEVGSMFIGGVQSTGGALELASGRETITGLGGTGTISGGLAMTFSGFGTYQFDAGGQFILRGTDALASGRTLADDGALAVAGTLNQLGTVTIGTDAAAARLLILKTGAWALDGAVITGGGASGDRINIHGALVDDAGTSEIGVTTFDAGTIEVAAGSLDVSSSLWGTGSLTIDPGAALEANALVGGKLTVDFNGASATLDLSQPTKFAATIGGFAAGDTIDLLHIKATGASTNASDQLVIVNGATTVATLQLSAAYIGATFTVGADKHGGTNITLFTAAMAPPSAVASPHPTTHAMVAAMAGLGAAAGSAIATTARDEGWRPILLGPRAQLA